MSCIRKMSAGLRVWAKFSAATNCATTRALSVLWYPVSEPWLADQQTVCSAKSYSSTAAALFNSRPPRRSHSNQTTSEGTDHGHYIYLKGLPFHYTEQHLIDLFGDIRVVGGANGVTFVPTTSGIRSGLAYVELASHEDVMKAVEKLHKTLVETWYISAHCASNDTKSRIQEFAHPLYRSKTGHTVDIINLGKDTDEQEIMQFFSPLEPVHVQVRCIDRIEWVSYKAHVDFSSHSDACTAMENNQRTLGGKRVTLKLLSYEGTCTAYNDTH